MEIKIIRSERRRKTVSATLEGSTLVVRAPSNLPPDRLEPLIDQLKKRVQRGVTRAPVSDETLEAACHRLSRRYLPELKGWRSVRWVENQHKRFGSCTPANGDIRISSRVAHPPPFVRDYVLIHEMAHLIEPSHSSRFWQLVNRYPRAERARGYLMALGLEEESVE